VRRPEHRVVPFLSDSCFTSSLSVHFFAHRAPCSPSRVGLKALPGGGREGDTSLIFLFELWSATLSLCILLYYILNAVFPHACQNASYIGVDGSKACCFPHGFFYFCLARQIVVNFDYVPFYFSLVCLFLLKAPSSFSDGLGRVCFFFEIGNGFFPDWFFGFFHPPLTLSRPGLRPCQRTFPSLPAHPDFSTHFPLHISLLFGYSGLSPSLNGTWALPPFSTQKQEATRRFDPSPPSHL